MFITSDLRASIMNIKMFGVFCRVSFLGGIKFSFFKKPFTCIFFMLGEFIKKGMGSLFL